MPKYLEMRFSTNSLIMGFTTKGPKSCIHENLIEKENHQTRSWSVFHFSAKIFPQKCGISEAITLNVDI